MASVNWLPPADSTTCRFRERSPASTLAQSARRDVSHDSVPPRLLPPFAVSAASLTGARWLLHATYSDASHGEQPSTRDAGAALRAALCVHASNCWRERAGSPAQGSAAPVAMQVHFSASTLDDLLRHVLCEILSAGSHIRPSKGPARDLAAVSLRLTNPRARISRTETRGKPYSCLGELCWYLAGSNALQFIQYYVPAYRRYADGNCVHGGYGPRLFQWRALDQFSSVGDLLQRNQDSRRAVIQLFDAYDLLGDHNDVPCTCTLQFLLRGGLLNMVTHMRSNDVYLGLPHDIFCFTMLQEILARTLSVDVGWYAHFVGSLHLYDINQSAVHSFLSEGWQSTQDAMPPMPLGDPWPAIRALLAAERALRTNDRSAPVAVDDVLPYWADLIRLLQIFRAKKDRAPHLIPPLKHNMSSRVYDPFIDAVLRTLCPT